MPGTLPAIGRWLTGTVLPALYALVVVHDPTAAWVAESPDAWDDVGLLRTDPCGERRCMDERQVFVDYEALGVGARSGGEWIRYDFAEVTRPLDYADLAEESEVSLAVRLIISEVGADRLLVNRYGLLEAMGILYTVDNRMDPLVYNVQDHPRAPEFDGCGPGGSFASCANAEQYLGMATWRALDPLRHYNPVLLEEAVDLAVLAWWLQEHHYVEDFTGGATNYVHRCGAAGYGKPTHYCDAHLGRPARDIRGANPHTGPIVFKAPTVFLNRSGFYGLYESRRLEYVPWWDLASLASDDDALADLDETISHEDAWVPGEDRFPAPDPVSTDLSMRRLVDAIGAPSDPVALDHLRPALRAAVAAGRL